MAKLKAWCAASSELVGAHALHYFEADATKTPAAVASIAKAIPEHYASRERIVGLLKRLGKPAASDFVREKLPQTPQMRSGDLGEIIAAGYVNDYAGYATVCRLRWKDHRAMAMRGDDVIGVRQDADGATAFLKGEVKSSASLKTATVVEARKALKSNNGRPSAHALSFLADRLMETGQTALADLIDDAQLKNGVPAAKVTNMLFVMTGNDARGFLRIDLTTCSGPIGQHSVALRIKDHQTFIGSVFDKVVADGVDG